MPGLDQPCPPRPVNGATIELLRTDGKLATTTRTGAAGTFRLTATAGHYFLRATNAGGYGSQASRNVDLRVAKLTTVDLTVDPGIR